MVDSPRVLAVMLANGRAEMVARAVRSFEAQTYRHKWLLIYDTTPGLVPGVQSVSSNVARWSVEQHLSIGGLRNAANRLAIAGDTMAHAVQTLVEQPIICHWDSDDWSHPRRIEEQVKHLVDSKADYTGYYDMVFWDTTRTPPESWLYSCEDRQQCLGTSLMYWRTTWERKPFPDVMKGEDTRWQIGLTRKALSSTEDGDDPPRMIASIHGANTASRIIQGNPAWRPEPPCDAFCEAVMGQK